ncbi:diphthine synthase [Archaeoglobus veneficus]|uniref:Diphthine synthase n=1 Tax=Archaeoglobus veneficus (strain DSM 11195 / SNP6) TaxID=693661 RepID=F2KPA2_ARCVS|nr:diphthine synthase [Archaeoglobus veneficus]AEA47506.1 diphthine synthase [Archaeoglobus veneficus SNP6]
MLTFIGMGLWDEKDISLKGLEEAKKADVVCVEFYTSRLMGTSLERIEELLGRKIRVLERSDLEENSGALIEEAKTKNVAILVPGDPMVATTHSALRLEAEQKGVKTRIIHGASISSAVCGLTGLHNYRFGKSATVSYPYGKPSATPVNVVHANWSVDAHTLLYLDLHPEPMLISQAVEILRSAGLEDCFAVGIARAGSDEPVVKCDTLEKLKNHEFGEGLHIMVILAETLHFMEYECLRAFASAPPELERLVK